MFFSNTPAESFILHTIEGMVVAHHPGDIYFLFFANHKGTQKSFKLSALLWAPSNAKCQWTGEKNNNNNRNSKPLCLPLSVTFQTWLNRIKIPQCGPIWRQTSRQTVEERPETFGVSRGQSRPLLPVQRRAGGNMEACSEQWWTDSTPSEIGLEWQGRET